MNQVARWRTVVAVTLCVAACTGKPDAVCTPGASVACTCGAQAGAQACNADGTGYDSCQCTGGGSSSGAVSSGGGSGSGGSSGTLSSSSGGSSSGMVSSSSLGPVTVAITAPLDGARVSGDLPVNIMAGGSPTTVTLLVDGATVATLTPPYNHSLNTRPLSEAAHTLMARAVRGSQTVDSAVVNITVDNTAPTLTGTTLLDRVDAPITATFSEPLLDSAVSSTSLLLQVNGAPVAGTVTHPTPETLVFTPTAFPVLPGQAQLSFTANAVRDLAGNNLAAATPVTASWTPWATQSALTPTAGMTSLGGTVAVLGDGTVVTADVDGQPGTTVTLHALAPGAAAFAPLAGPAAFPTPVYRVSVAAAQDNSLWLAVLRDGVNNNRGVEFLHQQGGNWASQAFVNTPDVSANWPMLQVAPNGALLCAFVEQGATADTVRVLRRNATGMLFGDLLEWPLTNRFAGGMGFALDDAGNPAVAVTTVDMVRMAVVAELNVHDGTSWTPAPVLVGIQPMDAEISLAFTPTTGFALAHTETDFLVGPNASLYVNRFAGGWLPLGRPLDLDLRSAAEMPRLAGGTDLVLAYTERRTDPGPTAGTTFVQLARYVGLPDDGTYYYQGWRGMAQALPWPVTGGFLGFPVRDAKGFVWLPTVLAADGGSLPWRTTVQRTNVVGPQQGLPGLPASSPCAVGDPPPNLLSETNCFTNLATMEPAPGVIPYSINSTLWSDAAEKNRWMVIPPQQAITFTLTGALNLPVGTILIKDFFIPTDPLGNPNAGRMAETRFLVKRAADIWDGYSYQWRDDGTDADLLPDLASTKDFVRADNSIHTHTYPSRVMCGRCHNEAAGFTLGLQAPQLAKSHNYGPNGQVANELQTLEALGLFGGPNVSPNVVAIPSPWDASLPVETRVRAYLHANCAQCHRPGGEFSAMDFRFETALADTRICNLQRVIPGDVANSKLHIRLSADASNGMPMPPLARRTVDTQALQLVDKWITEMTSCP